MKKIISISFILFLFLFYYNQSTDIIVLEETTNTYSYNDDDYYNYEEVINEQIFYLNDIYNNSSRVFAKAGNVTYGSDYYDNKISIFENNEEVIYEKGIASFGNFASYTITNVKEYGYDFFETTVGTTITARNDSFTPSFQIRIVGDGITLKSVDITDAYQSEFISVDLSGVSVLQIFIDTLGSGIGDFIALGNPLLKKNTDSAYLDVFDLEFNLPSQVTQSNLLEYPEAIDSNGLDISSNVKYITDYKEGSVGTFNITYYVFDSNNVMRERSVSLVVTGQDYSENWTIEDFKTPYVNYMYHARQAYPSNMKPAFDLFVKHAIDFNENDWVKRYRSNIYTSQNYQVFNLKENGIYISASQANSIIRGMHDCEPRSYMFLNVDLLLSSNYYSIDPQTGLLSSIGIWAQNKTTEQYNNEISLIIKNSESFFENTEEDMTMAQKWKYTTVAYDSFMHYSDGAFINSSLAYGVGKCNGNSQGLVHLSQRLGIKSIYSEGWCYAGLHAWTYQKLPDHDEWYLTDVLWDALLASVEETSSISTHAVYTNRGYTFPKISKVNYESYKFTYPSAWINFQSTALTTTTLDTLSLLDNISSFGSIFSTLPDLSDVSIEIEQNNIRTSKTDTSNLENGIYKVIYILEFHCDDAHIVREFEVDLFIVEHSLNYSDIDPNLASVTLYSGDDNAYNVSSYNSSDELSGEGFALNDGASKTIDVSNLSENFFSFKYGTSLSTRTNQWTSDNCSVSVSVYVDGVLITTSKRLTGFSKYIEISFLIPDDSSTITIKTNAHGSGGNHATVMDIKFGYVSSEFSFMDSNNTVIIVIASIAILFVVGTCSTLAYFKYSNKGSSGTNESSIEQKPIVKKTEVKKEVKKQVEKKTEVKKEVKKPVEKKTEVKKETKKPVEKNIMVPEERTVT